MPVEVIALAPETGRRAVRPAVDHIGDVADQRRIEDLVDRLLVVAAALVDALDLVDRRDAKGFRGVLCRRRAHGKPLKKGRTMLPIWSIGKSQFGQKRLYQSCRARPLP